MVLGCDGGRLQFVLVVLLVLLIVLVVADAALLVDRLDDGVGDGLDLLLLGLVVLLLGLLVVVEPLEGVLDGLLDRLLVLLGDLVGDALLLVLEHVFEVVAVPLEAVAAVDPLLGLLVLLGKLLASWTMRSISSSERR